MRCNVQTNSQALPAAHACTVELEIPGIIICSHQSQHTKGFNNNKIGICALSNLSSPSGVGGIK